MKSLIPIFISLLFIGSISAQEMSASQWKSDLEFLQQTVHKEYPFLFKKITKSDWDAQVDQFRSELDTLEDYEAAVGFFKLVSAFGYGHTSVGLRDTPYDFSRLPVHLKEFADGIYLEGVHTKHSEEVGARVVKIQGIPVEEVYKRVYAYYPAENSQFFKAYGMNFLVTPEVLAVEGIIADRFQPVKLTLEKNEKVYDREFSPMKPGERVPDAYGYTKPGSEWVSARNQETTPYYLKNLDKIYYAEVLSGYKTMYVRQSQVQDDSIQPIWQFYDEVFQKITSEGLDKLVIDLRLNGGGNNYKNKAVIKDIISHPAIDQKGKLFILIGDRTYSAAQNFVNELHNYTNAIFIGEPTGENINFYGDNNRVVLPESQIPVYLSFAWWQDKPQWEDGEWLAPHIAVSMTFVEYQTNKDPLLQTALTFDDPDFVLDPMDYLTGLYQQGDMQTLAAEAIRLSRDERYRYYNLEERLVNVGNRLLNRGQVEEALALFQLTSGVYPESAKVWKGLSEVYKAMGNTQAAQEAEGKYLSLLPKD